MADIQKLDEAFLRFEAALRRVEQAVGMSTDGHQRIIALEHEADLPSAGGFGELPQGDSPLSRYYASLERNPAPPIQGGTPEKTGWLVEWMVKAMYDAGVDPLIKRLESQKKERTEGPVPPR